jgi:hypothetical protein
MLDNPNPSGPFVPIPTLLQVEDLYIFLWVVRDQDDCPNLLTIEHDGEEVHIPTVIHGLSVQESFRLIDVADRFDCEAIGTSAKLSLEVFYASLGAWELLEVASEANSLPIAKRAIIKMTHDKRLPIYDISEWWTLMSSLRPTWQLELTKLVWVFQKEIVDRPLQERRTLLNGRKEARMREAIMVQSSESYEEVAAAFNPQ